MNIFTPVYTFSMPNTSVVLNVNQLAMDTTKDSCMCELTLQVASFKHGLEEQSSIFTSQLDPVQPMSQVHV